MRNNTSSDCVIWLTQHLPQNIIISFVAFSYHWNSLETVYGPGRTRANRYRWILVSLIRCQRGCARDIWPQNVSVVIHTSRATSQAASSLRHYCPAKRWWKKIHCWPPRKRLLSFSNSSVAVPCVANCNFTKDELIVGLYIKPKNLCFVSDQIANYKPQIHGVYYKAKNTHSEPSWLTAIFHAPPQGRISDRTRLISADILDFWSVRSIGSCCFAVGFGQRDTHRKIGEW